MSCCMPKTSEIHIMPKRAVGGTNSFRDQNLFAFAGQSSRRLSGSGQMRGSSTVLLTLDEATDRVTSWMAQPCVRIVRPTERHWDVFRSLLLDAKARGNLVTDAHLAAIAIEHGCELCSTDSDFARFPRLKWRNPLTTIPVRT